MGKQGSSGGGLTPAKAYLTLYNLAQFGLWAAILLLTARQLLAGGTGTGKGKGKPSQAAVDGVWPAVGPLVKLAVGAFIHGVRSWACASTDRSTRWVPLVLTDVDESHGRTQQAARGWSWCTRWWGSPAGAPPPPSGR